MTIAKDSFVHLHTHSHYSLLDGQSTIPEYIEEAKRIGHTALGLSDHGNTNGIFEFVRLCKEAGITPVPGSEFYVAPQNPEGARVKHRIYYGPNGEKAPEFDVSGNGAYTHQTIWAINNKGLENLFALSSLSWKQENYYSKPRIDFEMLAEHSEGLVVATGCPSSEISTRFLLDQDEEAYQYARRLKEVFGDRLFVEIMSHDMKSPIERLLLPKQLKLSQDLDIPLLATNDAHYARQEDHIHQEEMLCAQSGSVMSEPSYDEGGKRFAFDGDQFYLKTSEEMAYIFPESEFPGAIANTKRIAEMAEDLTIEYNPNLRPKLPIPEGYTRETYFQHLINEGYEKKRSNADSETKKESKRRIAEEYEVISSEGFIDYFLVVWDYIRWARENGVGVGIGRGSIGGSEIAYLLDISRTCPIRYGLLFERFLSSGRGSTYRISYTDGTSEEVYVADVKTTIDGERKYIHQLEEQEQIVENGETKTIKTLRVTKAGSMPDVDTDFDTVGRNKVIRYVTEKYGASAVANIVTFGTYKARQSFKQMCTIYEKNYQQSNKIAQMIPPPVDGHEPTILELFDTESERYGEAKDFRDATADESWKPILRGAASIEGRVKSHGMHAAGVIISSEDLLGKVPTQVRQSDNRVLTQWDYPSCEEIGLIKMDFLGLDTIDLIQKTLKYIERSGKPVPDMDKLIEGKMDDKKTFDMIQSGNTIGVFQIGKNPNLRELLKRMKPDSVEDIIATTALYRPGPMGMNSHIRYADRKNGTEEIEPIHPEFKGTALDEILDETYYLLVYQEQIMQIANRIGGMTLQEGDNLRSAMGKKKMHILEKMKPKFMEGGQKNGYSEEALEVLWSTMEPFAKYAFNKAHSASYAITSYQTAYLKANYPVEFMAAAIAQYIDDKDRTIELLQEANSMGIKVGPVDINHSDVEIAPAFEESDYDVVYGFSGVSSVSVDNAANIVQERQKNGYYTSVQDVVRRNSRKVDRKTIYQSLALSGAFDQFNVGRKSVYDNVEHFLKDERRSDKKGVDLFSMMGGTNALEEAASTTLSLEDEYPFSEKLKLEADMCGFYLSSHPLEHVGIGLDYSGRTKSEYLMNNIQNISAYKKTPVRIVGAATDIDIKVSRAGNRSYTFTVDDGTGYIEIRAMGDITKSFVKYEIEQRAIAARAKEGLSRYPLEYFVQDPEQKALLKNENIPSIPAPEKNDVYVFETLVQRREDSLYITLDDVYKLKLDRNGRLPVRLRLKKEWVQNQKSLRPILAEIARKHPGDYAFTVADASGIPLDQLTSGKEIKGLIYRDTKLRVNVSREFVRDMEDRFTMNMFDLGIVRPGLDN